MATVLQAFEPRPWFELLLAQRAGYMFSFTSTLEFFLFLNPTLRGHLATPGCLEIIVF